MNNLEKQLWKKVHRYLRVLNAVPFLRLVAVCNNLAFGKVREGSDIDLFIVAKSGRLFVVRSFVTFLLQIMGVRRHGSKVNGRFCLSFFVDDCDFSLEKIAIEDDVYLALWIRSLCPVINNGVLDSLFERNKWTEKYVEDALVDGSHLLKAGRVARFFKVIFSVIFSGGFGDFVEKRLMKWQLDRAREKISDSADSGLVINEHMLKFHRLDRRKQYRNMWKEKFGEIKITRAKFAELEVL